MQQLPNNCRIGNVSVFPKNWESSDVDVPLLTWFYDDNVGAEKAGKI